MSPDVVVTYEQMEQFSHQIRLIYAEFNKKLRPSSDLNRYIALCEDVTNKIDFLTPTERLELHNAQRILGAIVDCYKLLSVEERAAFKGLIAQIEANPLVPEAPHEYDGLNAVFELEFLQYLRHRKFKAKLGEPDVVISNSFGNYYVACKSINSLKNIEHNLVKAASQIAERGVGFVALNFEPHVYYDGLVTANDPAGIVAALDKNAHDVFKPYEGLFESMLAAGDFDGITIQVCCVAKYIGGETESDTMIHNIYYSRPKLQSHAAVERFNSFRSAMKGYNSFFC